MIEASDPDDKNSKREVRLRYRLAEPEDIDDFPGVLSSLEPAIGFVPLAEEAADLDLAPRNVDQSHWYDVCVSDLSDRVEKALKALCRAGAEIVIIPEMTVHPKTLRRLKKVLSELKKEDRGDLRLIILGSKFENDSAAMPPQSGHDTQSSR